MKSKAHILKDCRFDNWDSEVFGRWTWHDLRANPDYYHDWASFDGVLWHPTLQQVFCGLTLLDNDIFHVFDPRTGQFRSLNFRSFGDRFDAKFHRSMELDEDGTMFCATALLHDQDVQFEAAGGKLLHYNPFTETYRLLDVPVPHHYIQSITLDRTRRIIYGFTYPGEYFFRYDIESEQSRVLAFTGNGITMGQPHYFVVDEGGTVWATWAETRAFEDVPALNFRLFTYHPDGDEFTWLPYGLPLAHEDDLGLVDGMLLASDGMIYVGTKVASLVRIDPRTKDVELLGCPGPRSRMSGLEEGPDGRIYMACGTFEETSLFAYDPEQDRFTNHGLIYDHELGTGPVRIHDLAITDDLVIYAGENDNVTRSSYLWECALDREPDSPTGR
jgi:sugar lactone lactonase YvrE